MPAHRASIDIAATPDEVFSYLIRPELLKQWINGFVESRPVTQGETGLGTKSVDVFEERGRQMLMATEIVGFEPGRLLAVTIRHSMLEAVSTYRLDGSTPTSVSHHQELRLKGVARLFSPFMRGATQRSMESDLARLKQAVERGLPA